MDRRGHHEAILGEAVSQLEGDLAGTRITDFDLLLNPHGRPFQQSAWALLRTIPYGQTVSYAYLAHLRWATLQK